VASDEVVQLYLTHPGVAGAPIRSLQGFQRIHLKSGEKKTVQFALADRALSIVDANGKRSIQAGRIDVWIGGGQPVARAGLQPAAGAHVHFAVVGSRELPE
jgi:beta-glucosidase